jgi:putative acetyltransferase
LETSITIAQEQPDGPDARALITERDDYRTPLYPLSSHYCFSVEKLIQEKVSCFVLRCDGAAAGRGGLLLVNQEYAEIKRVYVRPAFRGRSLGVMILENQEFYVRQKELAVLRRETGTPQPEAQRLCERLGFYQTTAIGSYVASPYNLFYEKHLT